MTSLDAFSIGSYLEVMCRGAFLDVTSLLCSLEATFIGTFSGAFSSCVFVEATFLDSYLEVTPLGVSLEESYISTSLEANFFVLPLRQLVMVFFGDNLSWSLLGGIFS